VFAAGKDHAAGRGSKRNLRGTYYSSPFMRDLQNCPQLLSLYEEMVGEPVMPHATHSNTPHINLSTPGSKVAVDHWHVDSLAYNGVILLSDVKEMEGGDLELFMGPKKEAYEALKNHGMDGLKGKIETVSYEEPGKMILCQGSEIFHHVTPVLSNTVRISTTHCLTPRNAFQPPKTLLATMMTCDHDTGIAPYEYYREKTWHISHVLSHFAKNTPFSADGTVLGAKLRPVIEELTRAANILDSTQSDAQGYFDEEKGSTEVDENKTFNQG